MSRLVWPIVIVLLLGGLFLVIRNSYRDLGSDAKVCEDRGGVYVKQALSGYVCVTPMPLFRE